MSQVRALFVWTGGTLATAGLLGAVMRLVGAHQALPYVGGLGVLPFYGAAIGATLVGVLMVATAPSARRASARVRLDERPVQEQMTLRPKDQPIPTTTGFKADPAAGRRAANHAPSAPVAAAPPAKATAAAAGQASGAAGATATVTEEVPKGPPTRGMPSDELPAWGTPRNGHPNDPAHDPSPRAAPRPAPAAGRGSTIPPVDRQEATARTRARRVELHSRLEELETKANQAKVRYGLGKVSAAGYRQYLAEVDRERMMIESELMETEENA